MFKARDIVRVSWWLSVLLSLFSGALLKKRESKQPRQKYRVYLSLLRIHVSLSRLLLSLLSLLSLFVHTHSLALHSLPTRHSGVATVCGQLAGRLWKDCRRCDSRS